MLDDRFLRSMEDHWEEIGGGTIRRIRKETDVPHMQQLSDSELRQWARGILDMLRLWPLMASDKGEISRTKIVGRPSEKSIPLDEIVRCLQTLKVKIIEFARDREFGQSTLAIFIEEELEHQTGLFFDWLVYSVIRDYEEARRRRAAA